MDAQLGDQPQDLNALWQELERERTERQKEGGRLKKQVEELGKESLKQLDSIQDLCNTFNLLSALLSQEQQETFHKAQEFLIKTKQEVERVRRKGQQHKQLTADLLDTIKSLSLLLSPENGDGSPQDATSTESMARANEHLVELKSRYDKQQRACESLVESFSAVVETLDSESQGFMCGTEELDLIVSSFFEMHAKLLKDAKDGKGTAAVIEALTKATAPPEDEKQQGGAKWWLMMTKQTIEEGRLECEHHKKSIEVLVSAINMMKLSLNDKLQEKVLKSAVVKPSRNKDNGDSKAGQLMGTPALTGVPTRLPYDISSNGEESDKISEVQRALKENLGTSAALEVHLVDNHILKAPSPGLGYRNSPTLSDMDAEKAMVPWGSLVCGTSVSNDEWLKVGEQFLPKKLDGVLVLRPYVQGQDADLSRRSHGSGVFRSRSKGRQPTPPPALLDPIPEGSSSEACASSPPQLKGQTAEDDPPSSTSETLESIKEGLPQSLLGSIMDSIREQIKEEVVVICNGLQAPGGPLAPDTLKVIGPPQSSRRTGGISLDDQVKDHIEEVAKRFVNELWQGSSSASRGSEQEASATGVNKPTATSRSASPMERVVGDKPTTLSAVPVIPSSVTPVGQLSHVVASSTTTTTTAIPSSTSPPVPSNSATPVPTNITPVPPSATPVHASPILASSPLMPGQASPILGQASPTTGGSLQICAGTSPPVPTNGLVSPFLWQDPRSRPNSIQLANARNLSGSPDRAVVDSNAPPSSPERINLPCSIEVRRTTATGHPGPPRTTAVSSMMSKTTSSPSPTPRGRRLSQGARPIATVAGHKQLMKPYSLSEASMQRSGSSPGTSGAGRRGLAMETRSGLSTSASPGPDMNVSPSPGGASRYMRPAARHHMPFSSGPLGVSRKTCPARTSSPESYFEVDAAGRPIGAILSV